MITLTVTKFDAGQDIDSEPASVKTYKIHGSTLLVAVVNHLTELGMWKPEIKETVDIMEWSNDGKLYLHQDGITVYSV